MQSQGESVYRYKAKADRLLLPILFFFGGSLVIAHAALSTARGFYSAFLWLVAFASLAYAGVPVWCLTRHQHITITPTSIRVPSSPLSSGTLEIPYAAISYLHADGGRCAFVFAISSSRRTFCIKQSLLPSQQDFDEICRVLYERAPKNETRAA
jgi:hypothetical protein